MAKNDVDAPAALERVLSAYGFKQQKELAERLGIHANNVSSWLARNVIPSNVFVECALDTGADLRWLVNGELANAKLDVGQVNLKGKQLYDEIMANGGRAVL
ncbi:helix-turn-helix domain containing protein, partial [Salmonella enterica subsp. enterica serovar Kentucky]|nr:helix-turn-helix domain containing protein [Salmonella enterica subsp. enterica serovar Kentucky]